MFLSFLLLVEVAALVPFFAFGLHIRKGTIKFKSSPSEVDGADVSKSTS